MSDTYALEIVVRRADGAVLENEQRRKCQRALTNKGYNPQLGDVSLTGETTQDYGGNCSFVFHYFVQK